MVLMNISSQGMPRTKKSFTLFAKAMPNCIGNPMYHWCHLELHSKGIGYAAWCEVEKLHPEVKVWETVTPYFEQRNIHFYVNRCGFHIVEFFNKYHQDPNDPEMNAEKQDEQFPDGMFRFEKVIR